MRMIIQLFIKEALTFMCLEKSNSLALRTINDSPGNQYDDGGKTKKTRDDDTVTQVV